MPQSPAPSPAPRTVRVFLLDDHEVVRAGIRSVLEADERIQVVGEAGDEDDGLRGMTDLVPDVAVVDVRLAEGSGIETFRRVRDRHPEVKGLVLTGFDEEKSLLSAVLAGASGYLTKDINGGRLVDSVIRVAEGQSLIDPSQAMALMQRVRGEVPAQARRRTTQDEALERLTPQERKILALIAEGMSNREIAEQLFLVEKTVRNHITRILAKLGVQRRTQAALIATRMPTAGHPD